MLLYPAMPNFNKLSEIQFVDFVQSEHLLSQHPWQFSPASPALPFNWLVIWGSALDHSYFGECDQLFKKANNMATPILYDSLAQRVKNTPKNKE